MIYEIKNNPDYSEENFRELLEYGRISEQEVIEAGIITSEGIRNILNPPEFHIDQDTWQDMDPLPEGPTDIYFFGIPGSGKTCVLSGILSQADRRGLIRPNSEYRKGIKYLNSLKSCTVNGYAPPTTQFAGDTVNFIQCRFVNEARTHDLSFIEMSGEYFVQTYQDTDDASVTLNAKGFLENSNNKLIFFVIDYYREQMRYTRDAANQSDMLVDILGKLQRDGTLDKTDSIQFIITKSDLIQEENKDEAIRAFLEENYATLVQTLKELNKEFGINAHENYKVVFHPFTYGRFMVGRAFEFNPEDSDKLVDNIINSTQPKRPKNKFLNIFK